MYFKDYEEENNLICSTPTEKMLAEIALKGILLQLSKRLVEKRMFEIGEEISNYKISLLSKKRAQDLDIRDYTREVDFYKSLIRQPEINCFQVLLWKLLPYTVPIATQTSFVLPKDMNDQMLVDVSDLSDERIQNIHIGMLEAITACRTNAV